MQVAGSREARGAVHQLMLRHPGVSCGQVLTTPGLWVPLVHIHGVYILPGIPRLFTAMLEANKSRFTGPKHSSVSLYTNLGEGDVAGKGKDSPPHNPHIPRFNPHSPFLHFYVDFCGSGYPGSVRLLVGCLFLLIFPKLQLTRRLVVQQMTLLF